MSLMAEMYNESLNESRTLSASQKKALTQAFKTGIKSIDDLLANHFPEYDTIYKMNPHENFDSNVERFLNDLSMATRESAVYGSKAGQVDEAEEMPTGFMLLGAAKDLMGDLEKPLQKQVKYFLGTMKGVKTPKKTEVSLRLRLLESLGEAIKIEINRMMDIISGGRA